MNFRQNERSNKHSRPLLGDRQNCGNYRGISLLAVASKIFAKILLQPLLVGTNDVLPEAYYGFRSSRGTIDMIFTLRQLQEKAAEQNKPLYIAFVDFLMKFGGPDKFFNDAAGVSLEHASTSDG